MMPFPGRFGGYAASGTVSGANPASGFSRAEIKRQIVAPVLHQLPPLLKQVGTRVCGFGATVNGVRQRRFGCLARDAGLFRRPVPERGPESVRHGRYAQRPQHFRQGGVGHRPPGRRRPEQVRGGAVCLRPAAGRRGRGSHCSSSGRTPRRPSGRAWEGGLHTSGTSRPRGVPWCAS